MRLYLKQLELGPLQNFVYLIGSLETREAAVVDPAWDVPRILKTAQEDEMRITTAIVTHTHFDHTNGVEELLRRTDAQVVIHKKEAADLPVEKSNLKVVEGGHEISLGKLSVSFLHTPGHTPGSQCIAVGDCLIAGDTLFIGGCGRCDLPGGDAELMYQSLTRLSRMDGRLSLYPGHNYAPVATSTLEEEKSHNPFLTAKDLDGFLSLVGAVRRKG
ncbi:MAG: MBL fold metallo-hydrolase [Candidatus Omnitrophica bacterium]|nr:MBL fold metallo-hydrolase [Candidatus Omnitrophota bacterium]